MLDFNSTTTTSSTLLHQLSHALSGGGVPLGSAVWKYVRESHQNDPLRTFLELLLVLVMVYVGLSKKHKPSGSAADVQLTEKVRKTGWKRLCERERFVRFGSLVKQMESTSLLRHLTTHHLTSVSLPPSLPPLLHLSRKLKTCVSNGLLNHWFLNSPISKNWSWKNCP